MAEEMEIMNVGNDGVASEVTLERVAKAIEHLAKKEGYNPKKAQEQLNKMAEAAKSNVEVVTKNRDALKDHTKEVKESSQALSKLGRGLLGIFASGIGSAVEGVTGFAKELAFGGTALSDFARHIPIVGNSLTAFTGVIDNSFAAFQNMAKSGADFGYDLGDLRSTAANARMSLEEFSTLVQTSSNQLAAFGGNVTQGARRASQLTDSLGSELREQLLGMGLSFEEITESMAYYQYLDRAGSRARNESAQAEAAAAASLTKNMLTLAKLTGQDIDQMRDRMAQEQMDMAFQMEMARLDPIERDKLNAAMQEAFAQGGPVAVNALKAEFLGMPPLTRELQIYTATQTESANLISELLRRALDSSVSLEEFQAGQATRMADYLESQIRAGADLESIIKAGAAGAEGLPAELSAMLNNNVDLLAKYMTNEGGQIQFAREQFLEDYEAGLITPDSSGEIGAMAQFTEAIGNARSALMDNFINPLMTLVTPIINEFTGALGEFVGEDGESTLFQNALSGIREQLELFKPKVDAFLLAFKEDPKKAIADAFAGIGDALLDFFLGPNTRDVMGGPGGMYKVGEEEIEREGGFLQNTLGPLMSELGSALVSGLVDTISALWDEMGPLGKVLVAGAAALFLAPGLTTALVSGIGSLMASAGGSLLDMAMGDGGGRRGRNRGRRGRRGRFGSLGAMLGGDDGPSRSQSRGPRMPRGLGMVRGAGVAGAVLGGLELGSILLDDEMTTDEKIREGSRAGGGMAGGAAGAAAGAAIGSVVPVVGTVIGGLIGGALGYFGGSAAGGAIGDAVAGDPEEEQAITEADIDAQISQLESLNRLAAVEVDHAGLEANMQALAIYSQGLASITPVTTAGVLDTIRTSIVGFMGGETDPMQDLKDFSTMELGPNTAANSLALRQFAYAMSVMPTMPESSILDTVRDGIVTLLGGETNPYASLIAFSNMTLGANTEANALALRQFGNAMSQMPQIDSTRTGGVLGAITGFFAGEEEMPWDKVAEFGNAPINAEAVTANANAMIAFGNALTSMPSAESMENIGTIDRNMIHGLERISALTGTNIASVATGMQSIVDVVGLDTNINKINSLDTVNLRNYTTAMEDLVDALGDLNTELSKDVNGWSSGNGFNAGEAMQQIGTSTAGSNQQLAQLNNTMMEVLTVLREQYDVQERTSRNTRGISGNLVSGGVTGR